MVTQVDQLRSGQVAVHRLIYRIHGEGFFLGSQREPPTGRQVLKEGLRFYRVLKEDSRSQGSQREPPTVRQVLKEGLRSVRQVLKEGLRSVR